MDPRKIADVLRGTINPNERQQAEEQLSQIQKVIGFAPTLLQVIMSADVEMPVRQAGVIYMKNFVSSYWMEKESEPGQPLNFNIHEQDRAMLREAIVDALIQSPELLRVQLGTMLNQVVKNDFPSKWTGIVDKINVYLQSTDPQIVSGALMCLHHLVKVYEYRKNEERAPLLEALNLLLPQAYGLMLSLAADTSDLSLLVQKQILKTFYALVQHSLPLTLLTREKFAEWMIVARNVADRAVPDSTLNVDEDERPELPAWKCRKWAMHVLTRTFERYGSPGTVSSEYSEFAEFYLNTFSTGILEVMVRILDASSRKIFVTPRVMQLALSYVTQSISHAVCWKLLKPHMQMIIQNILFPLLCFTPEDAELWDSDPHEYIRVKFDIFAEFVSPITAARDLLTSVCKKRKDQLQPTMIFLVQVLTSKEAAGSQKDGALHMVGALSEVLVKKKLYRNQMDSLLAQYVLPEYQSPHGHLRARACWVMHHFCEIKFKDESLLKKAVEATVHTLLHDPDLPVKIEASIALQALIGSQDCNELIKPQIGEITLRLLEVLRESENDDMTNVIQQILLNFQEEVAPLAVQICQHLVETFAKVVTSDEEEDKAITAMSLVNTISTLINIFEDEEKITEHLEPVALQVIGLILVESRMEYYEEAFSLVEDLTTSKISTNMWKAYELLYQTFQKDACDYFNDMMPALHNYVTIDTEGFLSDPNRVHAAFEMAKTILTGDSGEDPECHAAKLLEVIILQCKGRIDNCIPTFVELALSRLLREVKTSELRIMLLQVVIAALYYNPPLLLATLEALPQAGQGNVVAHFIKQWIHDTDCFLGLHDRKLCVLGICTLLAMPAQQRPAVLNELLPEVMPSCILLFDGLKRAYEAKAAEALEDEKDGDSDEDEDGLATDEDEIDEAGQDYLEQLERKVKSASDASPFPISVKIETDDVDDEEDDSDDESDDDDGAFESYTTVIDDEDDGIDEYMYFKEVLLHVQSSDPVFYNMLTAHLKPGQQKDLAEIVTLADQRHAARESKKIEKQGGYQFVQQTVPQTFNFGGGFSS